MEDLYSSRQLADCVMIGQAGHVTRCHSLVIGAASSMLKIALHDASEKTNDTDFVLLMPDFTQHELEDFLKPAYGLNSLASSAVNPLSLDFNIKDRSSHPKEFCLEASTKHKEESDSKDDNLRDEDYNLERFSGHSILGPDEVKPITKRKRGRPRKTRHGYLNDDFIDDEDTEWIATTAINAQVEKQEPTKSKKKRGRPKKIKEEDIEELQQYDDEEELEEIVLEPVVKIKEEEIERSFNEFNEFFTSSSNVILDSIISFNQDDNGMFHCEASGRILALKP